MRMRALRRSRSVASGGTGSSTVPVSELDLAADGAIAAEQATTTSASPSTQPGSPAGAATPRGRLPTAPSGFQEVARRLVRMGSGGLRRSRSLVMLRGSSLRPPELPRTVDNVREREAPAGGLTRSHSATL